MSIFGWFRRGRHRAPDLDDNFDFVPLALSAPRGRPARIDGFPGFEENAHDSAWRGARGSTRLRMRGAFTPAQPISDIEMFAGRRDELLSMIRAIEDHRFHVVVYGDRGIGKTSMLHIISYLAQKAGYLVRYFSCSEGSDFSSVFRTIAQDIPIIYHGDTDPTSELAENGGSLADLMPPGDLTASQVSELFAKITGTRVLIMLDEFDRADSAQFRRWTAELIKNLSDRSTRVQLVIAGVAANLSELIEHIPSVRRNIFGLPVPNMRENEINDILEIGAKHSGIDYGADARARIALFANGSPYLANLLGQHAGLAAIDRGADAVTAADVKMAVERALVEVKQRVAPRMLHALEKVTDPALGAALDHAASEALTHAGHIGDSTHAPEFAALAQDHGLLAPAPASIGEGYQFVDDGVALYVWLRGAEQAARRG